MYLFDHVHARGSGADWVLSNGGGKIEFVVPGGAFKLANAAAPSQDVGQPVVDWNGNVMIWSSYGDIAAGKGAKTSISPQFDDYTLSNWLHVERTPAGLPTGAGIGTLASQPGVPPADVDLVAPNGIVDAGDAGLRVSGNFNVFAVQILGTDNIEGKVSAPGWRRRRPGRRPR